MPEVIALGRKSAFQELVEPSPGREALPEGQRAENCTAAVESDALGNVDAEALVERDADAREAFEKLGVRDDAGAAPDQVVTGVLENVDVPARAQQQVGGEKAAERAAGDERATRR